MGITIENDQYYIKIAHIHCDRASQPGLSHLTPFSRMVNNYFKSIFNSYTMPPCLLRNHDPGIHDHPEHPGHMLGLANITQVCKGSRCSRIASLHSSRQVCCTREHFGATIVPFGSIICLCRGFSVNQWM